MKKTFAAVALAALVAFTGCDNKSTTGGAGTKDKEKDKKGLTQGENTFSLTTPALSTTLKQGESKDVDISIKKGKNFAEDVAVKFEDLPEGVTIDPNPATIKKGDDKITVTVKATDKAATNDFTIKYTAKPEKSDAATGTLKVTVKKK